MTTIYKQDLGHANWTGRVPRQSRITGEWSASLYKSKTIPRPAYFFAALAFLAFILANYL